MGGLNAPFLIFRVPQELQNRSRCLLLPEQLGYLLVPAVLPPQLLAYGCP